MKIIQCLILVIFLFSFPIVSAQEIPKLQKYVNDYAHVLSPQEVEKINSLTADIEKNTTVQIAVLIVNTTQPMTIEEYAVKVFEKTGIGYKDKDNGLLIVAAIQDKEWRIEVGYGLEPIITNAKAGLIGRTYLTEAFKQQQYGDGIYNAVTTINKVIQNSGDTSFISEENNTDFLTVIAIIIIALAIVPVLIIALVLKDVFYRKCPRCGTRMHRYYEKDEIVYKCPKCKKKIKAKKRWRYWFFAGGFGGGWGGGGGGGGGGGYGGGSSGGGGASGGW
jgi:uncharacterized protein